MSDKPTTEPTPISRDAKIWSIASNYIKNCERARKSFSMTNFIIRHRRTLMVASLVADIAIVAGVGVWAAKTWYAKGETAGIEIGHWHEREHQGTQSLANSCNTLADAYDMVPDAEKIAKHQPLKMDRAPCASIQKLADRMAH